MSWRSEPPGTAMGALLVPSPWASGACSSGLDCRPVVKDAAGATG